MLKPLALLGRVGGGPAGAGPERVQVLVHAEVAQRVGGAVYVRDAHVAAEGAAYVALNRRSRRFHAGLASPPREPAAFRACAWRSVRCGSTASRRTFSRGTGRQSRW